MIEKLGGRKEYQKEIMGWEGARRGESKGGLNKLYRVFTFTFLGKKKTKIKMPWDLFF